MPSDGVLDDLLAQEPDRRDDFGSEQFIAKRQGSTVADDVFGGSGLEDDASVGLDGTDPTIEQKTSLPSSKQDQFRKTAQGVGTQLRGPNQNGFLVDESRVNDVPDPREVHESRSEEAQRQDERLSAPLTNDPEQYANAPDEYDWPGVDSPPNSEASEASTLEEYESLF